MKFIGGTLSIFIILISINYTQAAEAPLGQLEAQRDLDRIERQKLRDEIGSEKLREKKIQQFGEESSLLSNENEKSSLYSFTIKEIIIEDDDKYEFSPARNAIINAYLQTKMGEQEVMNLVRELTNFYISRGYVTTQVTIVPGSLRSEKLVLKVLWGHISGFLYNGEEPGWREKMRMFSAMPFSTGKKLNISDIDQGLDNLLRVSPGDKIDIVPTDVSGFSKINHVGSGIFPLSLHAGVNNSGYRNSGWYQYYANASLKNVIGLNETFGLYYSYNDLNADSDNQYSKSFSFGIPLGYWSFDMSYYKSKYKKVIGGSYGGYVSNGQSERTSLKINRTLYRNSNGKFSGYLKTERRSNENYIMGFPIGVSSKNYSNLSSGLVWVGSIFDGWAYIDLSMTMGMPWFDAAWKNDPDLSGFDINYKKYNGVMNWSRRLITSENGRFGIDYELNSGFQFTNDVLVSDAKYSLGDEYSIRGYKENIVSAERAFWISNTIKMPYLINYARINQISPFGGFDLGMARHNCPALASGCARDYMSGIAAGLKFNGKDFSSSFTAGWPVKKPASLSSTKIDNHTFYFNLDIGF